MKMTDNKTNHSQKVVSIEGQRSKKRTRTSVVSVLQDTRATARAMQDKTCLLCHSKKLCVNRTGLCAACYNTLTPHEKMIADNEAAHKIITVTVFDDRWNDEKK
jgi:translation elongation factor EF-Tu-like GTPase